jgi:hypothetical protein
VKKRFSLILALALVFSLVFSSVVMAAPADTTVISNELQAEITVEEKAKTIQAMVDEASPEGEVEVPGGTYTENIIINKSLTLKPKDGAEVTINGHIDVAADNVTIEGFNIQKTEDKPAIILKGSNINIKDNTIDGGNNQGTGVNRSGIRVTTGTSANITGNYIVGNTGNGIWVNLSDDDSLTVENNTIIENRTGINFDSAGAATVTLTDNEFKNNTANGISIGGNTTATTFTITGNTFDGNQRSHFSDRRYSQMGDENVTPSREDIVKNNTIKGLHAWAWDDDEGRWLLVPWQENMLEMSWADGIGGIGEDGVLRVTVNANEENTAAVTAKLKDSLQCDEGEIKEISEVLFIMEIKDENGNFVGNDVLTATGTDGQSLGYDAQGEFWYWGPRQGFSFKDKEGATTVFTYSFNQAGEYSVKIYAVQLTE